MMEKIVGTEKKGRMSYGFRDLVVWKKSMELCEKVYAVVKTFPKEECYALGDQLRRAVVSIPSNIAEGNGRVSKKDYAHFLVQARGSLNEVCTQLELAVRLGLVDQSPNLYLLTQEINKMLNAMIRRLMSLDPNV